MAEKISIEIGLEGGGEVQRQLKDIEKTGVDTFTNIQSSAEQLDFSSISDGFQQVGQSGVQAFQNIQSSVKAAAAFEQIIQGVKNVEGAFESLGAAVTRVGARMTRSLGALGVFARALGPVGIALGVAGGAFLKFGNEAEKALGALTAEAAKLDLTAEQLNALEKSLTKLGIGASAIGPGLTKLKETMAEDFFPTDIVTKLQRVIAQLEQMPDSVQRTQLAMKLLGDQLGAQVIAGLQTGILTANNFAAALGAIKPLTPGQLIDAAKYQQAINQMSAAWTAFKAEVASPLLTPIFQFITGEVQKLSAGLEGAKSTFQTFKAMLSQDFDIPWLAKFVSFDPNLLLSKWQPVLQLIQTALGQGKWPALDALVLKAQEATQALAQTGQAAQQAGQQAAQGFTSYEEILKRIQTQAGQTGQAAQQAGQQGAQGFKSWDDVLASINIKAEQTTQTAAQAGQAGAQAGQQGAQGFQPWSDVLGGVATKANEAAIAAQQIKAPDTSSWTSWASTVVSAIQKVIDKLAELASKGGPKLGEAGGVQIGGAARGGLIGGRGTGTSDSNLAWVSRGEYVVNAAAVRQFGAGFFAALNGGRIPAFQAGGLVAGVAAPAAAGPLQKIDQIAQQTARIDANVNTVINMLNDIGGGMVSLAEGIARLFVSIDRIDSNVIANSKLIGRLIQDISKAISQKASGGLIGGRGTGTSDSNLAWLSRGEFVISAAAVRRFGAQFFAMLNAGMMPGFALGGLVPAPIRTAAFAGGGSVGPHLGTLELALPSGTRIAVRASSSAAEELRREAALAQVRSGGRKPSRYS